MSEKKVTARMVEAMNAANLGEVDALLNANPDLDNQFQGGVLGWAKSADVARYLISRGRNLNSVHPRWGTPVARAIRDNNSDVVQVLLCTGARTDLDDCILCSAVQKSLALVQLLAEGEADIHEEYYASALACQMNALSLAMAHGKKDIADYLRSLGAVMPGEKPGSDVGDARTSNAIEPVSATEDESPTPVLREIVPTYIVVHDLDRTHGGIGHVHIGESELDSSQRLLPGDNYKDLSGKLLASGEPIPFLEK